MAEALGEDDPHRALAEHLAGFKAFALGVACRTGREWRVRRPLRVALPFAIPATQRGVEGDGELAITGFADGALQLEGSGPLLPSPLPVARHAGLELVVSSAPWHVPGLACAEGVRRAGAGFHERHLALVQDALAAIARYAPESFEVFRAIRWIGLQPRSAGDDWSDPELPGAFLAGVVPNPLELGDHFIHELQHNRLSAIEERGPLFDPAHGDAQSDARFFSPWRDKPRALYGIFHGIYVFVAVTRYWLGAYADRALEGEDRDWVVDRLLRLPRQLALAVGVVERHARFTPLGCALFERLAAAVAELRAEIARIRLPADAPALVVGDDGRCAPERSRGDGRALGVREALREHVARNDFDGACAAHLAELERADAGRG